MNEPDLVGMLYHDALNFAANCARDMAAKIIAGELQAPESPEIALAILATVLTNLANSSIINGRSSCQLN